MADFRAWCDAWWGTSINLERLQKFVGATLVVASCATIRRIFTGIGTSGVAWWRREIVFGEKPNAAPR
jgi:hypothetical protein